MNEIGLRDEIEDGSSVKISDFPMPDARADFSRKPRMPKLPPRKSQFMRMGCGKSCDADCMSNGEFKSVIGEFKNMGIDGCSDKCCTPNKTTTHTDEITSAVKISVPDEYFDPAVRSDMAKRMKDNLEKGDKPVADVVVDMARGGINLITPMAPVAEVLNVEKLVWVQVPCAVDSGSCANVAPENVFKLADATIAALEPKFFGADGSPIANLGTLIAEGMSEEGIGLKIDFDIAKVTRPLLSVFKMNAAGHRVQFHENGGTIQMKGTNKRIKLRPEGRLYMLDLWCQVPAKLAESSPFIRQVAKA